MAFKSVEEFNEEMYRDKFRLVDDKDRAEVIFLYRSKRDELRVDAHYIRSADYTGYVHCCGRDCPACAKGIRLDTKLFIPLYNLKQTDRMDGEHKVENIEFWDRMVSFDKTLDRDVFYNYANPSELVFEIVRNGEASSRDTRYSIRAIAKNTIISYDDILAKFNAKMPDYYSKIIKEFSAEELAELLKNTVTHNSNNTNATDLPDYTPIPRAGYQSSIPDTYVDASEAVNIQVDTPDVNAASAIDETGDEEFPDPEF